LYRRNQSLFLKQEFENCSEWPSLHFTNLFEAKPVEGEEIWASTEAHSFQHILNSVEKPRVSMATGLLAWWLETPDPMQ